MSVFIIAEIGTAHEGTLDLAELHVDAACTTGADAVKFQCYKDASFLRPDEPPERARFFLDNRLCENAWRKLAVYCQSKGIEFMASAFDKWAVDLLTDIGVHRYKVASRTLRDAPELVDYIVGLGKPVYISFGMANIHEHRWPDNVTPLHCVSKYPVVGPEARLGDILYRQKPFGGMEWWKRIGYSDHTIGITAPIAAVALGATVIEKHFRLEPGNPDHPDHCCSLNPEQFTEMVFRIRELEMML